MIPYSLHPNSVWAKILRFVSFGAWGCFVWRSHVLYDIPQLSETELRHEVCHVAQWQRYGWGFPPRYLWYFVRYGYRNNPLEKEAFWSETQRGG
jgi:hypothetical protein